MSNKKDRDSDTEENSERPSGSESDEDSDPEDHKGAAKKQRATASSSEESDVSEDESSDDEPPKKADEKKSDPKDTNISLKKANEPSDSKTPVKKTSSSDKKKSKKDDKDDKKVSIKESSSKERNAGRDGRAFGLRESYGTLRAKRKSKKAAAAKDKEGLLQKKGNISRKWERKYVKVSSATRTIFIYDLEPEQNEPKAKQAPRQVIALDSAVIYARVQRRGAEMQSYFNVRANNRDYLFKASSPEEKSEWVAGIKSNKNKKEEEPQAPALKGSSLQTPESQKKQDKNVEKASNLFFKLIGRESYLGVAKDS